MTTPRLRILHLSDIHLGVIPTIKRRGRPPEPEHSAHYFQDASRPVPTELANILIDDLGGEHPDVVVVSGDVGWSGILEDYGYALVFLRALRDAWPRARFVVAPGNHDVDRTVAASSTLDAQNAFIAMLREFHGSDAFERAYPLLSLSDSSTLRHRLVAFDFVRDQHLIVAVNSAAALTTEGTPVFLDPRVLRLIRKQLPQLSGLSAKTLRILVLHHHLFPFADPNWGATVTVGVPPDSPDPTLLANSAKLQGWLSENQFHVVLHGHRHQAHGRFDVLWRRGDPGEGRRLLVVGAGSAGVMKLERGPEEPLGFNLIEIRPEAEDRWSITVDARRINDNQGEYSAAPDIKYLHSVGAPAQGSPRIYSARSMDVCHSAIASELRDQGEVRSFISVVEDATYIHPETLSLGSRHPSADEVESSFRALHPEWDPDGRWGNAARIEEVLSSLQARFQYQHGPRLFGILGKAGRQFQNVSNRRTLQPIWRAVDSLGSSSNSRAYAGLYNAEIDIAAEQQPLPGLMGLQFVPDGKWLDAVATFRKVELSFWWAVNMYEIGELLRWASRNDPSRRKPRRITFFAALAEWKEQPEVTFVTELDRLSLAKLCTLVVQIDMGDLGARSELVRVLLDKIERTNEANLDDEGVSRLAEIVHGVLAARDPNSSGFRTSPIRQELLEMLRASAAAIHAAEHAEGDRRGTADSAKALLTTVVRLLQG